MHRIGTVAKGFWHGCCAVGRWFRRTSNEQIAHQRAVELQHGYRPWHAEPFTWLFIFLIVVIMCITAMVIATMMSVAAVSFSLALVAAWGDPATWVETWKEMREALGAL